MLKRLIMLASGVLLAAVVILGPTTVWSTLQGAREVIRDKFEAEKSDAQRAAEIQAGLKDLDDKILAFNDKLGDIADRADASVKRVKKIEAELAREREFLTRAKALLDEGSDTCLIGGRRYSRAEVSADARSRLTRCEQLATALKFEQQVARQLADTVAQARDNLAKAQELRRQKQADLETLLARLENAKILAQVYDLTRELRASPLGPQTDLAQKLEAFERYVAGIERRASATGATVRLGSEVDWEAAATEDISTALGRFLNGEADKDKGSK
jgi:peptidoglycan hydrolase CwlO-like protein